MILVTGGSGLLGKELITQLLAQQHKVVAIYNKTPLPNFTSPLLSTVACDILDVVGLEELMQQGITQIYHCAALVSFNEARKKELYKINIEGTANIVNAAINAGVLKMVHVSSVAALGANKEGEEVDENMRWTEQTNNSIYGESKYLGELEVWRGIGEGLDAVIINPTVILGDGDWNNGSSKIFKSVYDGFPWYSEGVNGFVDVKDVVDVMMQLMQSDISAERFIVNAENCSYQQLFNLIAHAFNKIAPHKKVTPLLANIVWRLEAIKGWFSNNEPLVTKETALTALTKVYYNTSKLQQFLPNFKYRPLQETIQSTCIALQQKLNRS